MHSIRAKKHPQTIPTCSRRRKYSPRFPLPVARACSAARRRWLSVKSTAIFDFEPCRLVYLGFDSTSNLLVRAFEGVGKHKRNSLLPGIDRADWVTGAPLVGHLSSVSFTSGREIVSSLEPMHWSQKSQQELIRGIQRRHDFPLLVLARLG